MPTEQEVLDYLEEHGLPKDFRDGLRDKFVDLQKESKGWKEKAELYDKSQRTPLIEQALKAAKVDVSKIAPGTMEAIEAKLGDSEPGEEWGAEMATHFGLPIDKTAAEPAQPQPNAAGVVEQATGATGSADENSAFLSDLDAVPDGDIEATKAVLAKHGRLAQTT